VFADTSIHDGRADYQYAVKAVNYDNRESGFSNSLFGRLNVTVFPQTPSGLRAASDGRRILLEWKDVSGSDQFVLGYNIYRTPYNGSETTPVGISADQLQSSGYRKLNTDHLISPLYTDITPDAGISYAYAITSVDLFGKESIPVNIIARTEPANTLLPPADIYLSKNIGGIKIEWDKNLSNLVIGYAIFRRTVNSTQSEKLNTVNGMTTTYTDTNIVRGMLYFYSVATVSDEGLGNESLEKSIHD
jgi:fibronectin type 3 domain-containing protein